MLNYGYKSLLPFPISSLYLSLFTVSLASLAISASKELVPIHPVLLLVALTAGITALALALLLYFLWLDGRLK